MTKPIKILTLFIDEKNFGQRLQNYSLSQYIKDNFTENTKTLVFRSRLDPNRNINYSKWMNIESMIGVEIHDDVSTIDKNSILVIGSDQVFGQWNTPNIPLYSGRWIGTKRIITYSASTGENWFKEMNLNTLKMWREICTIPHLSFREQDTTQTFPNAQWHIDPVLLHDADWWSKLSVKPTHISIPDKFNVAMLLTTNNSGINPKEELQKLQESDVKTFDLNGNDFSPEEFVWMIQHCDTIHTSSFHGFVFGLLFGKNIHIYYKEDFRISNLINELGVDINDGYQVMNYDSVYKKLESERKRSYEYIKTSLEQCDSMKDSIECQPRETISEFNKYELCAYCKNQSERNLSTSGGTCARLAEMTFHKYGVVYGASYTRDFKKVHQIPVYSMNEYNKFIIGSKYSYCEPVKFDELKSKLDSGQFVTYIGCPCQIVALTKFLGHEYSNLLKVELLCSGTSDSKRLRRFVEELEFKYDKKVIDLNMRYNHSSNPVIMFEDGYKICLTGINTYEYFINSCRRIQCKRCKLHMGSECSDLTIGDFWNQYNNGRVTDTRFSAEMGTNYIFVNTWRGETAIKEIVNKLEVIKL